MSKVILITGASSGIGKASAQRLLQEGHIVYATARHLDKMKDLKEMGAITVKVNVTNDRDLKKIVDRVLKEQGKIDVLFNNAGFGVFGSVEETSLQDARQQFEVNLFGLARLTQLVIPHMRKRKSGRIINTSSMGGKIYTPLGAWYHASKFALEGWSDCLRFELSSFGIDVVLIQPGMIQTNFSDVMAEPMKQRSGKGPYKHIVKVMTNTDVSIKLSDPSVIADVVVKAVNAQRPKTRYPAGKGAKLLIFMRKWFGDRLYDWGMHKLVKQ